MLALTSRLAEVAVEPGKYADAGAAEQAEVEVDSEQAGLEPVAERASEGVREQPEVAFAGPAFAYKDEVSDAAHARGAVDASASGTWAWPGWPAGPSADVPAAVPDAG